jgi:hypothetical protein
MDAALDPVINLGLQPTMPAATEWDSARKFAGLLKSPELTLGVTDALSGLQIIIG